LGCLFKNYAAKLVQEIKTTRTLAKKGWRTSRGKFACLCRDLSYTSFCGKSTRKPEGVAKKVIIEEIHEDAEGSGDRGKKSAPHYWPTTRWQENNKIGYKGRRPKKDPSTLRVGRGELK